jgi:Zn-dependent peptidase ImmA (M78 family)/transcriptional regulator with XRE-family HTH domain
MFRQRPAAGTQLLDFIRLLNLDGCRRRGITMDKHVLNTIDPEIIGERLSDARRARRLTQQQAANELGVARTTITAMEKGERRPRATELVTLARLYGRPIGEFVRPESVFQPNFIVQFRAVKGVDQAGGMPDIQRFGELCRWYVELEEQLGAPLPRHYPGVYDISNTPPERVAEEAANSERNRLGLGDGPIGNLWGLLETDIGLRVFAMPMSNSRIAGMFLYTEEYGGCIAVNANHPEERRRLSAAHEYAHFLTDRHKPDITILNLYKRVPENERFADAFARFFLMPASGLSRRFEAIRRAKNKPVTPADVLALSHLYHVSFQAMTWRLEELKLLPSGTWDRLHDMGFKPTKAKEPMPLPTHEAHLPNLPLRYVALAVQAFEEGMLSEGQLAERLGTDRIGARERVHELTSESRPTEDGGWQQVPLDLTKALVGAS